MSQEIKKIPIVIASILKPVDDTRMLGKIGHSIGKKANVEITIIGYPTTHSNLPAAFNFFSFPPFKRLSVGRIRARFTFFRRVLAVKPRLLIITTHELLFVSLLAKWITGCRLIYDVQENYYRNILHSPTFPIIVRQLIALLVRLKEKLISGAIDHFFLAEAAYQTELGFLHNRFSILQNKASKHAIDQCTSKKKSEEDGNVHLIFSGTLARNTGVFEAIRFTKLFHQADATIRLTIIGHCAMANVLSQIKKEIENCSYISIIGGDKLVPHTQVLEEISKSNGAFVTYLPNASTSDSIPTKLFEYLALQIPIFLVPHPPWVAYCQPFNAAILLEDSQSPAQLLAGLRNSRFYTSRPEPIYWEDQEVSLLAIIDRNLS